MTRFLVLHGDYYGLCSLGAPSLTRGWVCHLSEVFVMSLRIFTLVYTLAPYTFCAGLRLVLYCEHNPSKTKLVYILYKNSVRTSKRTPLFTITKINWLTPFKEMIAVYNENHTKPINTKCSITDCQSRWFGLKGLNRCGMICGSRWLQDADMILH
jgi:hypothetical protein